MLELAADYYRGFTVSQNVQSKGLLSAEPSSQYRNMRIRSPEDEKRRSERESKISLNIPIGGKTEISQDEIYSGQNLLGFEKDLEERFKGLCLSFEDDDDDDDYDSSSSEDEEKKRELEESLVAKGQDKSNKKNDNRKHPYFQPARSALLSGGGIITNNVDYFNQTRTQFYQTPLSVAEFVSSGSNDTVDEFYAKLPERARKTLDEVLDAIETDTTKWNTTNKLHSKEQECCNSPDSSYGTMSPASAPPPSPYSLHSPNPPYEKKRVSESDSLSSDLELTSSESSFGSLETVKLTPFRTNGIYIPPPPRQMQTVCAPQPRMLQVQPISVPFQIFSRPIQPDSEFVVQEFGLSKPALQRLKEKNLFKDKDMEIQWIKAIKEATPLLNLINKEKVRNIGRENEDLKKMKDELRSNLIDLIIKGPKQIHFYERLYARIKLYSRNDEYCDILPGKDEQGYTPLLAAALLQNENPLIARLIVDTEKESNERKGNDIESFERKNIGASKLDHEDNTILHYLVEQGDCHAQVLSELLHSQQFDVNHRNVRCNTALHKAIECHRTKSCLACIRQLIKHGASLSKQDLKGRTALHLAVTAPYRDPLLLKALLQSSTTSNAINAVDDENNTPLHIAAGRNDLPMSIQKEMIVQLVHSGAQHSMRNHEQKTALKLVAQDRKEEIKKIFHRKNAQFCSRF